MQFEHHSRHSKILEFKHLVLFELVLFQWVLISTWIVLNTNQVSNRASELFCLERRRISGQEFEPILCMISFNKERTMVSAYLQIVHLTFILIGGYAPLGQLALFSDLISQSNFLIQDAQKNLTNIVHTWKNTQLSEKMTQTTLNS